LWFGADLTIVTRDAYGVTTPWVNKTIEETADKHNIKYKEDRILFGASDHIVYLVLEYHQHLYVGWKMERYHTYIPHKINLNI
jgi:putative aminopeptidase FrvX